MQPIFTETRPWGEFRQFTTGTPVTVKVLLVKAGERISLQQHEKRSEFWRVLSGAPLITIGTETFQAAKGDEIEVPVRTLHRIEATDTDVEILEISEGTFNEADISRIDDNYGRA
ncbi:MAG TPA: phosphomannose isomerase type II C-terminal cupin domain [Candidatus Paceibacterota bacterium]